MSNNKSIQILRASPTYDISQVELLDGQPFYHKGNRQLYVGDNNQEQLKPVGAANLIPGDGLDSVVQIYSGDVDSTHYSNANTGESAVVFGEANSNNANRALMWGKLNINSGQNIVGGLKNNVGGSQNIVAGQQNGGIGTVYDSVTGTATIPINALGSLVLGGKNKVGDGSNKSTYILVAGAENTIGNASYSITAGHSNRQYGSSTIIVGASNISYATNSVIAGTNNNLSGTALDMIVSGSQNTVVDSPNSLIISKGGIVDGALRSIIGGHAPTVSAGYVLAGGYSVNVSNSQGITWGRNLNNSGYAKAVFGEANDDRGTDTMLEVGIGARDASYRKNAFEVYRDGRAKVYTAPQDDNDVVRLAEIKKLDLGQVTGDGFIKSISQTDGKVSATTSNVATTLMVNTAPNISSGSKDVVRGNELANLSFTTVGDTSHFIQTISQSNGLVTVTKSNRVSQLNITTAPSISDTSNDVVRGQEIAKLDCGDKMTGGLQLISSLSQTNGKMDYSLSSANIGNIKQPIYVSGGKIYACNFEVV